MIADAADRPAPDGRFRSLAALAALSAPGPYAVRHRQRMGPRVQLPCAAGSVPPGWPVRPGWPEGSVQSAIAAVPGGGSQPERDGLAAAAGVQPAEDAVDVVLDGLLAE